MTSLATSPAVAQPASSGSTPTFQRSSATAAATAISAETPSKRPPKPCGHSTCQAKNSARFRITPTTAAVIADSGAVQPSLPWLASTSGPPARMKTNEGKKVKKVTTVAASAPPSSSASGPSTWRVQPPTKPTKATTMINGPGVVSPSARPSIICAPLSQCCCSTAPW